MADYVALATFKAAIGKTTTGDDAEIARAITAASRGLDRLCRLPDDAFVAQSATKRFDVTADERAALQVPALRSVDASGLTTDEDGDRTYETTWATTDYVLYPLDGPPYYEVQVDSVNGLYSFPVGQQRVQIAGSWGVTATVPPDIEQACILLAHRHMKRDQAVFGILGDAQRGFVDLKQVDPDVWATVSRWINPQAVFV